jgi:hypothetical protein
MARDPGGRGLAGIDPCEAPGAELGLAGAARELAVHGRSIGIVTGFPILSAGGAAETDGPPGALYLARACRALGMQVDFVCDPLICRAIEIGCEALGLDCGIVPFAADGPAGVADFWQRSLDDCLGRGWSHLISVERPGPTHSLATLDAQPRVGQSPHAEFLTAQADDEPGCCRNMRGDALDALAAPVWRLFERIRAEKRPIATLGLIDGGNEIGAGSLPWETIARRVRQGGRIACRVPTDSTLVAGVTDWAAYALSLATAAAADRLELAGDWSIAQQAVLIQQLVDEAKLVDGVSGAAADRVDGLKLNDYLGNLGDMRVACSLPE